MQSPYGEVEARLKTERHAAPCWAMHRGGGGLAGWLVAEPRAEDTYRRSRCTCHSPTLTCHSTEPSKSDRLELRRRRGPGPVKYGDQIQAGFPPHPHSQSSPSLQGPSRTGPVHRAGAHTHARHDATRHDTTRHGEHTLGIGTGLGSIFEPVNTITMAIKSCRASAADSVARHQRGSRSSSSSSSSKQASRNSTEPANNSSHPSALFMPPRLPLTGDVQSHRQAMHCEVSPSGRL